MKDKEEFAEKAQGVADYAHRQKGDREILWLCDADLFYLRSALALLVVDLLDEINRVWKTQKLMLLAFKQELSDLNEESKEELFSKIQELETKYDVSHNGILTYLEQVKKNNIWFQEPLGDGKQ
ncbi:MAG: hypothetical protein JRN52_05105 [Nitrososphaerota archaeon]|nr:hypothetical protein [Nitrososphaerota archaeon]